MITSIQNTRASQSNGAPSFDSRLESGISEDRLSSENGEIDFDGAGEGAVSARFVGSSEGVEGRASAEPTRIGSTILDVLQVLAPGLLSTGGADLRELAAALDAGSVLSSVGGLDLELEAASAEDDAVADDMPLNLEAERALRSGDASRILRSVVAPALGMSTIPTDPELFFLALSSALARVDSRSALSSIEEGADQQRIDSEKATEARRRAAASARRARRWLGRMPKWVKKLISAITTAVGAAASAFTGGASLALAIAGAVLLLAAPAFQKLAIACGMDPDKARWVGLACQIVGAALMAGAGAASGAGNVAASGSATLGVSSATSSAAAVGASAASSAAASASATTTAAKVLDEAREMMELLQAIITASDGVRSVGASVNTFRSESSSIEASRHQLEVERSRSSVEQILEAMKQTLQSSRAMESRVLDMTAARHSLDQELLARVG